MPNIALAGASGKPALDARQSKLFEAMYRGQHAGSVDFAAEVAQGFQVRDTVFQSIHDEMALAGKGAVSPNGFARTAKRIGRLMRDHYNLAFEDVGGWDRHVFQGGAQGAFANRIGDFGKALATFVTEIGSDAWRDTTVVALSEFGRTFRENGNKGADHGHGRVYWVMGGGVRGGADRRAASAAGARNAQPRPRPAHADRLSCLDRRGWRRAHSAYRRSG